MKRSNLSKAIGAGIIAAGLAIVPTHLPASAQTDPAPGTNSRTTTTTTIPSTDAQTAPAPATNSTTTTTTIPRSDVYNADADRGFDWGWLGLLGLTGLFGLIPRKREETVRYTTTTGDRDPAVRTDYR
ncbi:MULTISPECIES: WGxxGxxG family protein [Microcoleaceae]|uniref:WGxxGxxG family protein n=1 Tax=Microcoleaceae TaxID=1892252 RepID=UPI00188170A2|nr:WGxxGxxG family protein [Tychonema sp. LEGE 06208]MBE9165714.1 WGxxGxxG-CTERM domain-containing protein [Tychonema sp. LEGE 06208]